MCEKFVYREFCSLFDLSMVVQFSCILRKGRIDPGLSRKDNFIVFSKMENRIGIKISILPAG